MYKENLRKELILLTLVSLLIGISVVFVSVIEQPSPSGNIVAQGGRISNVSINQSANTNLWGLVYGMFDYATGSRVVTVQGGNITPLNITTYGYDTSMVVIAYNTSFNQSNISQALPAQIDAYLGVGPAVPESGTNTFSTLYNITIGTATYELYGAQTISSNVTFVTAAFLSNGNLGFVSTTGNGTAFDGSNASFQIFLPSNGVTNFTLDVVSNLTCAQPFVLDAQVFSDNESIFLNWTNATGSLLHQLYISDGPNTSGFIQFTENNSINLSTDTYLDNPSQFQQYYTVSTFLPAYKCDSDNRAGMLRSELTPSANLVSFPFDFVNDSIDSVVSPIQDYVQSVNRYNNTDQIYDFYIQFSGSVFKNFDQVLRGEGYWFTVNNTINLTYAGRITPELNITLYNRSNLVGFPILEGNVSVPYVFRSIDGNYSTLNVYNNSAKLYGFYIIFGGSVFSNFDTIQPGLGYWLLANETETLVLP